MDGLLIHGVSKKEVQELISTAVEKAVERLTLSHFNNQQRIETTDHLLTKKQAAEYLKVSLPTISKYIRLGFVKAHSVAGTRLRFRQSELDKALKGLRNR